MKNKTGLFLALAAAVLSLIAKSPKKEIIKMLLSDYTVTNSK